MAATKEDPVKNPHFFIASISGIIVLAKTIVSMVQEEEISILLLAVMAGLCFVCWWMFSNKSYLVLGSFLILGIIFLHFQGPEILEPKDPTSVEHYNQTKLQEDFNLLAQNINDTDLVHQLSQHLQKDMLVKIHLGKGLIRNKKLEEYLSELNMISKKTSLTIIDAKYNKNEKIYESLEIQETPLD